MPLQNDYIKQHNINAIDWYVNPAADGQTGRFFQFTFFHEAGHILLHSKKDIFLETQDYPDQDRIKENEADAFAILWTLTEDEETMIRAEFPLTRAKIVEFAGKFNTHPAVIIGRLQHKQLISYSFGREFFEKVVFE